MEPSPRYSVLKSRGLGNSLARVLCLLAATAALAGAGPTIPVPADFAGVSTYPGQVPPALAGKVGVLGKTPGTSWPYIEKTSSTPNWAPLDQQLADMQALGLTHFVYLIGLTPGWAVANHAAGTGSVNSATGQWNSWLPPDSMASYTNFVQALLTRYPQIELVYNYCEPQDQPIPYATAIAMDTELIDYVHTNFPGVLVGSPTIQPRDTDAQNIAVGDWYFDYWNQGGPEDFDVLLWHGYPGLSKVTPSANTPERVASRRGHMQALINHFGFPQPVWDEESSWGSTANATTNATDTVAFVSQDLLLHWNFGDARFVWYGAEGLGFGTLASGGVLNATGVAWSATQSWMLGSTLSAAGIQISGAVYDADGSGQAIAGTRSGVWTRPGGYSAISVWTVDGSASTFAVPANSPPYAQYRDTAGNVTPITGGSVPITGRPVWIETAGVSPIFEDDYSAVSGATRALPSNGYSTIDTGDPFTPSSAAYLESAIPVGTPAGGQYSVVTYTPTAPANSWSSLVGSVTVGGVSYKTLNGAFDVFVSVNASESGSAWFHPVDVDGRSGTSGMRLVFAGTGGTGALGLEVQTGSPTGLGTAPGTFTANNTYSLSSPINNVPNPFVADPVMHLGIAFATNPASGQVTMKVFGVPGTGPIDTTTSADLLKSQSFYISGSAVGATALPSGAWSMWARPYNGSSFTTLDDVDYDTLRLYQTVPAAFPGLP